MSKIHVLDGGTNGVYNVVVHINTPTGNNAVGVPWATAISNSGRNISNMPQGNGPGQITQAELIQVQAGTVIEGSFVWQDDPTFSAAQRQTDVDLRAQQLTDALIANLALQLKYYGYTR